MVTQAFSATGVTRVVARTMAVNLASRRVLQKVGWVYVRTHVRQWDDPISGWEQGKPKV